MNIIQGTTDKYIQDVYDHKDARIELLEWENKKLKGEVRDYKMRYIIQSIVTILIIIILKSC